MQTLHYAWINVFTTKQNQGNPLPVVILEKPLPPQSMQQIATMFNQSETIFIEDAHGEIPLLHIYTPAHELPLAGHPIIGALEMLHSLRPENPVQKVRCKAGIVATTFESEKNIYWIKAPAIPVARPSALDIPLTAKMLGLSDTQIISAPIWLNSGSEQLLVQIKDANAIDNLNIDLTLFTQYATLYPGRTMLYLWAKEENNIYARYIYLHNGAIREDSGTGSAAANLGGWHLLQDQKNIEYRIQQGTHFGQESILFLKVTAHHEIWIGGQNYPLGSGTLYWQA